MFAITNLLDWTNVNSSQPVSQLAAKLGSGSDCCGLHSCGRFWTWWWTVWVVPTFTVYFSKSIGHQKTLRRNLFSCFWTHLVIPHEKGKVRMINITASACQHAIINFVRWNISLWIQRHSLVVFLLSASRCFDIRALLKETNLLLPQVKMDVLRATAQTKFPMVATGPFWAPLPSSCLFLPLIYPLRFPSQGLFHLELLEIPLSVERHPSLALSSHFRRTCDSAQNEYNKHLNLSGAAKWLPTGLGEGNTLTGKMFMPWRLKTCKRGLGTVFQGLSSQTEQDRVCLSWQTGQGSSSMFSIQITIMFSHWTTILF